MFVHTAAARRASLVSMFFNGCAVGRQTLLIMIALRLAKVLITNAVEEDHEDRDCHKEQDRGSCWIDQHPYSEIGFSRFA
jgi:hypothetical protein